MYNLSMVDENSVSVEQAAVMLSTDIESILAEALDLGINLEHDPESGLDYLSTDDFDRIKESWITKD